MSNQPFRHSESSESPDSGLNSLTATFRQPDIEAEFQRHHLAHTQQQVRFTAILCAILFLVSSLSDMLTVGLNGKVWFMFAARLLVVLTAVSCVYQVARHPQSVKVPRYAATTLEIAGIGAYLLIIWLRPTAAPWNGMGMALLLIVVYQLIPNTFLTAVAVALTATIAYVLLWLTIGLLTPPQIALLILLLAITNIIGIIAARRHERLLRQEFYAQRVMREALAAQRQFVAMVSHEFRTPLAIIDAAAQRLNLALEQHQPTLTPNVHKIRRAVSRLTNLMRNCLTEERLATSDLVPKIEAVDLNTLILRSYGEESVQNSPRIRLVLPETPLQVHCDPQLIDIALTNLVTNALKYSPDDCLVTIRLLPDAQPGKIAIRVEDHGKGVPPADRERIFDRFYRGANHQRISGAGLGLHLARDLARRHGGDVTLEPECEGFGAVFTLTIASSAHLGTLPH